MGPQREHNHELLSALSEVTQAREDIERLQEELAEARRGNRVLQAELEERTGFLRRACELKARVLTEMSHDFRSPLGSIVALAGLLLSRVDGELSAEQQRQVSLIRRSSEEILALVNRLLELAKTKPETSKVEPEPVEVTEVWSTLRALLKTLPHPTGVEVRFEESPEVPPLTTDGTKVTQVLWNFLYNALKHTEQGEIRVGARALTPELVEMSVEDTGPGISVEHQEALFDECAPDRVGLGLPLARQLGDVLGGHVSVESERGRGSAFRLVLPRRYRPPVSRSAGEQPVGLLIDDDEASRYLVRRWLGSRFRVAEASSVAEARRFLDTERPDFVVLDLQLPDGDGQEVLALLEQKGWRDSVTVLLFTGQSLGPQDRALLTGVKACISKEEREPGSSLLEALRRAGIERETRDAHA